MGLQAEVTEYHWMRDEKSATWTRVIVVPRKFPYHPEEEGPGGPLRDRLGPRLTSLRDARLTVQSNGESTRDNWRQAANEEAKEPWTGRCTFFDKWSEASDDCKTEVAAVAKTGAMGELLFHEETDFYPVDDLSGEPLDPTLTTSAKCEEITEMYRRSVWLERWVEDCDRDTGTPPMPVRWVKTNKGDKMDPKVRCRLVAKHT